MPLNTRLLGSSSEAVVAAAAAAAASPGIHIQEPPLIGSTTALVGTGPAGPRWRSPSLCRRRYHFWMLIKMLARLKGAEG